MQELSDGDLLYMIHFDRNNFTPKWIQKAEREAQRRRLTLHVINDDYRATSPAKVIEAEIDLSYSAPRSRKQKLLPWIIFSIIFIVHRLLRHQEYTDPIVWLLLGLALFFYFRWRGQATESKQT